MVLLSTPPTTQAGCLAALRYVGAFAIEDDSALFNSWIDEISGPGAAFLAMIADALERATVQS